MNTMRIEWLDLPDALDQTRLPMPPTTADFLQVTQLANLVTSLFWGNNDFYVSPENQLAGATSREDVRTSYAVAREPLTGDRPDRIIGYAALSLPWEPASQPTIAEVNVAVHPDFRRRGVGSALLREAEAEAVRRGRTVLQAWTDNALVDPAAVGSGPVFVSGTSLETGLTPVVRTSPDSLPDAGRDRIRWQAPDAAFAAAHGYELAQVEWTSVLDLREAAGAALMAESGSGAAEEHGYDLVSWEGACPEEDAESMAGLLGRMAAEAPAAALERVAERWNVPRLRAEEGARREMGLSMITTAARDRSTGQLVGHSDIETFADLPQAAYQGNSLVHPEHRGRGLAVLLKAVNVSQLLRLKPEAERLYTWNAAENGAILRANQELGFVPVATHPAWQKRA
ncbi:acetyltransferase (GNAT) family protein [Citricoccus muralis]|uniref:Acetyltransferase (GNAT) family protein n=2 Tax=Citricoccus muralis TaxID=169134 RepID=A0A3D9LBZ0_9MICC|nr:acetyltransferase (GNAT) family protein [Citricoccus muralis]